MLKDSEKWGKTMHLKRKSKLVNANQQLTNQYEFCKYVYFFSCYHSNFNRLLMYKVYNHKTTHQTYEQQKQQIKLLRCYNNRFKCFRSIFDWCLLKMIPNQKFWEFKKKYWKMKFTFKSRKSSFWHEEKNIQIIYL